MMNVDISNTINPSNLLGTCRINKQRNGGGFWRLMNLISFRYNYYMLCKNGQKFIWLYMYCRYNSRTEECHNPLKQSTI